MAPSLPHELLDEIFQYACMDTGYTGRSLSLVSREFNSISAPYKFQSICLSTGNAIFRFARVLKEAPPQLRVVRYLFIASTSLIDEQGPDDSDDSNYCASSSSSSSSPEGEEDGSERGDPDDESECGSSASEVPTSSASSVVSTSSSMFYEYAPLNQNQSVSELLADLSFFASGEGKPVLGDLVGERDRFEEVRLATATLHQSIDTILDICCESLIFLYLDLRISVAYPIHGLPRKDDGAWGHGSDEDSDYGDESYTRLLTARSFPILRELHGGMGGSLVDVFPPSNTQPERPPILPSLTHFSTGASIGPAAHLKLAHHCPSLTHIRATLVPGWRNVSGGTHNDPEVGARHGPRVDKYVLAVNKDAFRPESDYRTMKSLWEELMCSMPPTEKIWEEFKDVVSFVRLKEWTIEEMQNLFLRRLGGSLGVWTSLPAFDTEI